MKIVKKRKFISGALLELVHLHRFTIILDNPRVGTLPVIPLIDINISVVAPITLVVSLASTFIVVAHIAIRACVAARAQSATVSSLAVLSR